MPKQPTSLKTACIRVTAVNNTVNGLVEYSKKDICDILSEWSKTCSFTYWLNEHEADEEISSTHYHIVLKFPGKTSMPFTNIKQKFPYGDIESAKSIKNTAKSIVVAIYSAPPSLFFL
jgi:hypothetical protein